MSPLVRLHRVVTRTVGDNREALQLLGKVGDVKVLRGVQSQRVQVTEVSVHGVVLHDGDPGRGPQHKLRTGRGLRVVGEHGGVSGRRLVGLAGVNPVDARDLLAGGSVGGCEIFPGQVVRN